MAKKIFNGVFAFCFCLLFGFFISSTVKLNSLRGLYSELGRRVSEAETTSRDFAEKLRGCQSILSELESSVDREIRTARECTDLIEEIRGQVLSLETYCGDFDWGRYYQYWDSYFNLNQ